MKKMATRTFTINDVRYEALQKLTLNGVAGVEWVRWIHRNNAWIRRGNLFAKKGVTRAQIVAAFHD